MRASYPPPHRRAQSRPEIRAGARPLAFRQVAEQGAARKQEDLAWQEGGNPAPSGCGCTGSATTPARYRRPADRRSRAQRWRDAVAELLVLQDEYAAWLDTMPDSLREGGTGQALQAIVDLDLGELAAIEPPRGYGRD